MKDQWDSAKRLYFLKGKIKIEKKEQKSSKRSIFEVSEWVGANAATGEESTAMDEEYSFICNVSAKNIKYAFDKFALDSMRMEE